MQLNALLLSLTPLSALTQEAATPPRPLWVASWSSVPRTASSVFPMVRVEGSFEPGRDNNSLNPEEYAERLKLLPEGRRVLFWSRYTHSLWRQRADLLPQGVDSSGSTPDPRAPRAVEAVAREWQRFLELVQYCGGTVDHLVGDNEDWGRLKSWSIHEADFKRICGSVLDWRNEGLPCGADFGDICSPGTASNVSWNLAVSRMTARALNEAIWLPARRIFPRVTCSNFDGVRTLDRPAPDLNGHAQPWDNIVGNRPAPSIYGQVQNASEAWFIDPKDPTKLSKDGSVRLIKGSWSSLLLDVQQLRAVVRSAAGEPLTPWIALRTYRGDQPGSVGYPDDPRYYTELLRHATLMRTSHFLWWNSRALDKKLVAPGPDLDALANELSQVIERISAETGGQVIECLTPDPIALDRKILVSGARCSDGIRRWRLTVSPGVSRVLDRRTGKMIEVPPGEVGFWIQGADHEPAPNVEPVADAP